MKNLFLTFIIIYGCLDCYSQRLKATVSKSDSIIDLRANIRRDHRIFGYKNPDTSSQKLILLSVFTSDVEGNPYKCSFGSYYQTSGMGNLKIKFLSKKGAFIEAAIMKSDSTVSSIYILKKWVQFEK